MTKQRSQVRHRGRPPARRRSRRRSRWSPSWGALAFGALSIVLIVVVVAIAIRSDERSARTGVTDASAFDLPALDSEARVRLVDHNGRPTVVNFFASWCTACDEELPDFRRAAEELAGRVDFVFVNSNETGNWRPMAERNDILGFTLARDIGGSNGNGLYRSLGGTGGMPMTAFYDENGQLVDRVFGSVRGGALASVLAQNYGVEVAL